MKIHEHIWSIMINHAMQGRTQEESLNAIREHAAYAIIPDRVRSIIPGGTRAVSHFYDGASVKFETGDKLKELNSSNLEYYLPKGIKPSSFGPIPQDIDGFLEQNKHISSHRSFQYILTHLLQDIAEDDMSGIVEPIQSSGQKATQEVYGHTSDVEPCKFLRTGKVGDSLDYRNMVEFKSILTSMQLWKNLKIAYPNLTVQEVSEAMLESCHSIYGGKMKETSTIEGLSPNSTILALLGESGLDEPIVLKGAREGEEFVIQNTGDVVKHMIAIGAFNNAKEIKELIQSVVIGGVKARQIAKKPKKGKFVNNPEFAKNLKASDSISNFLKD